MNKGTKLLTLAAAALAAALVTGPKAQAGTVVSWGVSVGPMYVAGYHNPYRVVDGCRYYRYRPGPGWVHVSYGWGWRPHPRAVWIAPHRGPHGYWVRGCWR